MSNRPVATDTQNHQERQIDFVVRCTGCTREEARDELIAEEWDAADAIINLKAHLAEISKG